MNLGSKAKINEVLKEIEFLHESIESEFQELVSELIHQLHAKLQTL